MQKTEKYTYRIQWSGEDQTFLVTCLEFPSLMTHGETKIEALNEMDKVLKFVLEDLENKGKQAPEPLKERKFKGNISLRLAPETHEELVYIANEQDISLNQCIRTIIEKNIYSNTIKNSVEEIQNTVSQLSSELDQLKQVNKELMKNVRNQNNAKLRLI